MYAWATAYSYSFSELIRSRRLPPNYQIFEDDEVIHIPQWPVPSSAEAGVQTSANRGEVFIFRSGSYVTWGMDEEQSQRFLRNVIQGRDVKYQVEVGRYSQIGDEAMDYLYAPSQLTRVQGDIIVIGQPPKSLDAEAETTSDETTSEDVDAIYDAPTPAAPEPASSSSTSISPSTPTPPSARNGRPPSPASPSPRVSPAPPASRSKKRSSPPSSPPSRPSRPPLLHRLRAPLPHLGHQTHRHAPTSSPTSNLDRDNFYDEPEVYWENSKMEDHYRSICGSLDIGQRFETLNDKLDHCENLLGVVRALLTEKTTHRMELIIIGLIAFEAGLALLGHGWCRRRRM